MFLYRLFPIASDSGVDRDGRPLKSRVERVIDPTEARTVRQVFGLCGEGHGYSAIAAVLNASGIATPRGSQAWHASTVRSMVRNEIYKGTIVWQRTKKRDDWGQVAPSDRPAEEWVQVRVERLQIVSEKVWQKAHDQLDARRTAYLAATAGAMADR